MTKDKISEIPIKQGNTGRQGKLGQSLLNQMLLKKTTHTKVIVDLSLDANAVWLRKQLLCDKEHSVGSNGFLWRPPATISRRSLHRFVFCQLLTLDKSVRSAASAALIDSNH